MKKILIIPSWYPNTEDPGLGTFFREQAALFEGEFDVRIFAGHLNRKISRLEKLKNTIRFALLKKTNSIPAEDYFLSPPQVYGFTYSRGMNKYAEANLRLTVKAYSDYFVQHILPHWKPDLIHAQNTYPAGIIARHISDEYNIPYIITDHHHLNPAHPAYVQEEIKRALTHSKANCFVSEWQYRTYLLFDSRIQGDVIGNPVDTDLFKPTKKHSNDFVITHTSNADKPKDIETLKQTLVSFFGLVNTNQNISIQIIGFPDNVKNWLTNQLHTYKWFKQIKFYLPLPKTDYVKILQQSDVFLATSIYESFGLAPLEAILCGVPTVSTGNGGIDEYLSEGVNGIKVPLRDAEALARGVRDIYEKKIRFNPEKVRGSVIDKFNASAFREKMVAVYKKAMIG